MLEISIDCFLGATELRFSTSKSGPCAIILERSQLDNWMSGAKKDLPFLFGSGRHFLEADWLA